MTTTTPMPPLRIAMLEDMPEFAEQALGWLRAAGHQCHWYADTAEFLRLLGRESFDLVLLDRQLPDGSGDDVLRWMQRTQEKPTPAIFITSAGDEAEVAAMLDLGAEDYLVKPVRKLEVLARVRAVARRRGSRSEADVLEEGNLRIDTAHRRVECDGELVDLGLKEYSIALLLLRNLGRLLSREQIYEAAWGRVMSGTTRTVDTHVSQVRRRLGLTLDQGWRLTSVYQRGYRLERLESPPGPA